MNTLLLKLISILSFFIINLVHSDLNSALIAHYSFDGSFKDLTGNHVDVINHNTTFFDFNSGGVRGIHKALHFNGFP